MTIGCIRLSLHPNGMNNILIVHSDKATRKAIRDVLHGESYPTEEATDSREALEKLQEDDFSCVILSTELTQNAGGAMVDKMEKADLAIPVVLIQGKGKVNTQTLLARPHVYDLLNVPIDYTQLSNIVRHAVEKSALQAEIKVLKRKAGHIREIFGESPAIQKIRETISRVATTEARVLITGEEGTGKDLVARWIHEKSNRSKASFVTANCAAIAPDMLESELFGHEKDAFPSAIKQRIGKLEQAHGGTIHLEAVDALLPSLQHKLNQYLQTGKFSRAGSETEIAVDVRLIVSTQTNLTTRMEDGIFLPELYQRISALIIHIPSLNERAEDIPMLAEKFSREICEELGIPRKTLLPKALEELKSMKWGGNIRELRNVMERLIIMSGQKITEQDVKVYVTNITAKETPTDLFESFDKFQDFKDHIEKLFIEHKLKKHNWNVSKTAEVLDIQRSHLYNKIEKFELRRTD